MWRHPEALGGHSCFLLCPRCVVLPAQELKMTPVTFPNTQNFPNSQGEIAFHPVTAPITWSPFSSAPPELNLLALLVMFSGVTLLFRLTASFPLSLATAS